MTKPLGISDRCRGSRPCGQEEDTEKGGTTSAYLGIHGDSPESGQGLECSGGKKEIWEIRSHVSKPHCSSSSHSHPSSGCLTRDLKLCGWGTSLCLSLLNCKMEDNNSTSSQRCWQDQIVYNLCNEFTIHSSDILIITIANIYCLVLFQGFHELSLQYSERK